jgi:CRP-like cAMP-binding protein
MSKYAVFLKETELFYNLTATQLELMDSICEERVYKKGEKIFAESSREDELYLILQGEVQIVMDPGLVATRPNAATQPAPIAVLRRGQCFGEVALVDQGVRTASAVASEKDTRVLRIPRSKFLLLCNSYPELGYRVMFNLAAELAQKIRGADLQIRAAMLYRAADTPPTSQ